MKNYSAEEDRLLWTAAESNDSRVHEQFSQRYPHLTNDLLNRIKMIRDLRQSRPMVEVPVFQLKRQALKSNTLRKWLTFAGGGLALASVAFAVNSAIHSQQRKANSLIQESQPTLGRPEIQSSKNVDDGMHVVPKQVPPHQNNPGSTIQNAPESPFYALIHVSHDQAPLKTVLLEMALQAKIKLDFAPGMENPIVLARYDGIPARQAFDDLGQNFGFTVVEEGLDTAIVVPAIDPSKPPVNVPNGSYSAPADGELDPGNSTDKRPITAEKPGN